MAGTTTTSTLTGMPGSDVEALRLQFNKLVDDAETLRAALSAGGVTAVTELMDDHATNKTFMDEVKTDLNALVADVALIRTAVNAIITAAATDLPAVAAVTPAAAATATTIAASPAATLTAEAPSATAVDAAGDLTAAKVGDLAGNTT